MIRDNGKHLIVQHGTHGTALYPCTVETALALVDEALKNAPELATLYVASAVTEPAGPKLLAAEPVRNALVEVLTTAPGRPLPQLQRLAARTSAAQAPAPLVAQPQWAEELVLWAFRNKLSADSLARADADELARAQPVEQLSFLAPLRERYPQGLQLVPEYLLEGVYSLAVLRRNRWKEASPEHRVVAYHVDFLQSWAEGRWEIVAVTQPCLATAAG